MIRTNISLYEEQYEQLKEYCFENGTSISFVLRELIDNNLGTPKKSSLSTSSTGFRPKSKKVPKEITEQINQVLEKKSGAMKSGLCPICHSVLNQYGECNNKALHKK